MQRDGGGGFVKGFGKPFGNLRFHVKLLYLEKFWQA
jgi:hypothetical protein